jgi:hypothetical protein
MTPIPPSRPRISTRADLRALSVEAQQDRIAAAEVLSIMRGDDRISLGEAAERAGTTPERVLDWAGDALTEAGGHYWVVQSDDLVFLMTLVSTDGVVEVLVRGDMTRSLIGQHFSAIGRVLRPGGGDASLLAPFASWRIGRYRFETDIARLVQLWRSGQLDFLELYRAT